MIPKIKGKRFLPFKITVNKAKQNKITVSFPNLAFPMKVKEAKELLCFYATKLQGANITVFQMTVNFIFTFIYYFIPFNFGLYCFLVKETKYLPQIGYFKSPLPLKMLVFGHTWLSAKGSPSSIGGTILCGFEPRSLVYKACTLFELSLWLCP